MADDVCLDELHELVEAAAAGRTEQLQSYFAAHPDLARREEEWVAWALIWACEAGLHEVVEVFVDHGARLDYLDEDGCTPLACACRAGHARVVELLLSRGADIDVGTVEAPKVASRPWCVPCGGREGHQSVLVRRRPPLRPRRESPSPPVRMQWSPSNYEQFNQLIRPARAYSKDRQRAMMLCKVRSVADAYRRLRYPLPPLYSRAVERLTTFTRRVWLYQPRVSEDAPLHTRCRMQLEVIGRDRATEGRWLSEVRVVRGLMPLVRRPVGGKRLVDVFKWVVNEAREDVFGELMAYMGPCWMGPDAVDASPNSPKVPPPSSALSAI